MRPYEENWEQEQRKLSNLMSTIAQEVNERLARLKKDRQALCHAFFDEAVFDCFVGCLMSQLVDGPGG